jgi:hypothetical protein
MTRNFELRKSPVDGMLRRWELKRASTCRDLSTGGPLAAPDDDYSLWVCTGVFRNRREVFNHG